jgi:hypothetical protein
MLRNNRCAMALLWALLVAAPLARTEEAADRTPPEIEWQRPKEEEVFLPLDLETSRFIDVVILEEANGSGLSVDRLTAQLDGRPLSVPDRCWEKSIYGAILRVNGSDLRRQLGDGFHEITLIAWDQAGNEARDSRWFVLDGTQPTLWGITGLVLTPTARTGYGRGLKFGLYHNDERTLAIYNFGYGWRGTGSEYAYQVALDETAKDRSQLNSKFCFTARRPGQPAIALGNVNDEDSFVVMSYELPRGDALVDLHGGWGEGPLGKWFGGLSVRSVFMWLALDHSRDGWNFAVSIPLGKGFNIAGVHPDDQPDWAGITYVLPLD